MTVVVLHLVSIFQGTEFPGYAWVDQTLEVLSYTPLSAIWAGTSAVALFFILSGYALHRMLSPGKMTYAGFAARRIARLWIPYAATLVIASIGIALVGSHKIAGQSDWMNSFLGTSPSAAMLGQHLLMIGQFDTKPIDFVIWSLVLEMRISLIFPLIFWAVESNRPILTLIVSLGVGAVSILAQHHLGSSSTSLMATFGAQTYFVIGALISKYQSQIRHQYNRVPGPYRAVLFLGALTLYSGLRISETYSTLLGASWIIIVALCSSHAGGFLDRSPIQWLGKISYSLYLCHAVVLLFLINWLYPRLSFASIVLLAIPAIFLLSYWLNRFVEQPAIALSRKLGRQLGGSLSKGAVRT